MRDYLYFDSMITPKIITFIYWLMLAGCAQQERVVQMAAPSPTTPAPEPGSAASKILLSGMPFVRAAP